MTPPTTPPNFSIACGEAIAMKKATIDENKEEKNTASVIFAMYIKI